jgi:hypothetical protein
MMISSGFGPFRHRRVPHQFARDAAHLTPAIGPLKDVRKVERDRRFGQGEHVGPVLPIRRQTAAMTWSRCRTLPGTTAAVRSTIREVSVSGGAPSRRK